MKKIAIVQARLGSTRLPDKVLKRVGKWTVLEMVFRRLRKVFSEEEIIFAIPDNNQNDLLMKAITQLGSNYIRGDENDVYKRFHKVLESYPCESFIRVTADCPLLSPEILKSALNIYENENYDIVHSGPKLAEGLDFEIINSKIFLSLMNHKLSTIQRQHPTLHFYENKNEYKIFEYEYPDEDDSGIRITLDEKEDLNLLEKLEEHFGESLVHTEWVELKKFLLNNPEIMDINNKIIRNEGLELDYKKS